MESRERLILDHLWLVPRVAKRFWRREVDWQELKSCGYLALVIAADRWNGTVEFVLYASGRIRAAIIDRYRAENLRREWMRLGAKPIERWDTSDLLFRDLLGVLPERQRELFRLLYGRGLTWVEAARELGVAQSTVFHWHRAGLARLRREVEK